MNFSLQGVACFYLWRHKPEPGVLQAFAGVSALFGSESLHHNYAPNELFCNLGTLGFVRWASFEGKEGLFFFPEILGRTGTVPVSLSLARAFCCVKRGCHIQIALWTRCETTNHTAAVCRQAVVVERGVRVRGVRQDADEALTQSRFDKNSIQPFYV